MRIQYDKASNATITSLRTPRTEEEHHRYQWSISFITYIYSAFTTHRVLCLELYMCDLISSPINVWGRFCYHPHFSDEETEVQESYVDCQSLLSLSSLDQHSIPDQVESGWFPLPEIENWILDAWYSLLVTQTKTCKLGSYGVVING